MTKNKYNSLVKTDTRWATVKLLRPTLQCSQLWGRGRTRVGSHRPHPFGCDAPAGKCMRRKQERHDTLSEMVRS